jgi:outer membrane receptor for ferrienterochelin and colicins
MATNIKLLLLLGLIYLSQLIGFSQSFQLRGQVFESKESGVLEPLIGVNIGVLGTTKGAVTDVDGLFILEAVDSSQSIVISFIGYKNDTIAVSNIKTQPLNIVLEEGKVLTAVTIKAENGNYRFERFNARDAHIITQSELRKAACCNLSESFETNPSIDASYTDAVTGTKQIQMLGLSGKYVQIMQDNIPLIRGLSTIYGFEYVPGAWINSIHVSKGAGSVVNGYESMTGQLNIGMKNPENDGKFHLNFYVNSALRNELNLTTTQRISKRWKTTLLAHGKYADYKLDMNNDGFIENPLYKNLIVHNQWNYAGPKLHMEYGLGYLNINTQSGRFSDVNPYLVNNATQRAQGFAKIGYLFPNENYKSMAIQMSGMVHNHLSYFGISRYVGQQESGYVNFIFQDDLGCESRTYKVGASLVYDNYNEQVNNLGGLNNSYNLREIVPGVFSEFSLTKELFSLVAGARADYHNIYGAFFTPRLNARYNFTEKTTLKLSAGMGRRTANVFMENVGVLASSRQWIIHSDDNLPGYGLKQEVAQNVGLGFNQEWKIKKSVFNLNIDVYHTRFVNQIIADFDASPQEFHLYNLDGQSYSNSAQAELNVGITKRLSTRIAYRFLDVKTQYMGGMNTVPLIAKHRGFANIAYETRKTKKDSQWKFDLTAHFIGSQRIPSTLSNPVEFQKPLEAAPFVQMSGQITYVCNKKWEFYLGGENLTNYMLNQPIISFENPNSPYFDSSLIWGPIFGRMFYAGLRWTIE